jgi:hypothetical protein
MKIRDELAKLNIITGAGPVKCDPPGLNIGNPLSISQIQKRKPVCVEPADWWESSFIYPAPKWGQR